MYDLVMFSDNETDLRQTMGQLKSLLPCMSLCWAFSHNRIVTETWLSGPGVHELSWPLLLCGDKNTLTENNLGEETSVLAWKVQVTSHHGEKPRQETEKLKAILCVALCCIPSDQGTKCTAKEARQEPWRMILASSQKGQHLLS